MIIDVIVKEIKKNIPDNNYNVVFLSKTNWMGLPKWSSNPASRQQSIAYAFPYKSHKLRNKNNLYIHNPECDCDFEKSWSNLVVLNTDDQMIYYYENLELQLNRHWADYNKNPDGRNTNTYFIVGNYKTIPFSRFKSDEQMIKFCIFQWNRLNTRYEELVEQMPDKTFKWWGQVELGKKNKNINKQLKQLRKDFND